MADDSILVVGGGIAGLALARALRRRDLPVVVAERGGDSGGLAINLPGNAISAMTALGLGDGLRAIGRPTRRREYRAMSGRLLFAVDEDAFWGDAARPRCVRREDLLSLLAEGLDVTPRPPATVTAVGRTPAGAEVSFDVGDDERFGFVAGADGVRSVVRAQVFGGGTQASLLSAASWRFMAPNPGVDCWTVWSGPGAGFLLIPVDGDQVYGYASATGGGAVGTGESWLRETFAAYPTPVREALAGAERKYHSPIEEVRLATWAAGRCALIGDAAHATAPVWAQGAALAVEDALTLADELAAGDWDTAGARYEGRRRDRVRHVQRVSDRFARTAGLPVWLRDRLSPLAGPLTYRAAYGPLRESTT